jgi:glyoxylase-like metal-dependent hydrolase (beta-lactamase superfamily II)
VATPGHCANHLCFALGEENALFSGDHVMAWSTSVVAPPDGSMRAYMDSLEKLKGREETIYWPGHGGPVLDPNRYLRALIHHRRQREASILNALDSGLRTIPEIVAKVYAGLDVALVRAAAMSTEAHLEDLEDRGLVARQGPTPARARYRRA